MPKNYSTTSTRSINHIVVAGTIYTTGRINKSYFIQSTAFPYTSKTFTAETTYRWYLRTLTDAGEQVVKYWRVASLILYIAANRKPAPAPEPIAAVCMGYGNHHFNLPTELQNAPAVAYIGMRHVCEHCKAQHDRALAHLTRLQSEAASIPVYEDIAVAAQDSHMTENIVKIKPVKLTPAQRLAVKWMLRLEPGPMVVNRTTLKSLVAKGLAIYHSTTPDGDAQGKLTDSGRAMASEIWAADERLAEHMMSRNKAFNTPAPDKFAPNTKIRFVDAEGELVGTVLYREQRHSGESYRVLVPRFDWGEDVEFIVDVINIVGEVA